jgi:hypothetical protein
MSHQADRLQPLRPIVPRAVHPPIACLGWRRTTRAMCVGTTFQDGSKFSSGLTVRKVRWSASAGRKLA